MKTREEIVEELERQYAYRLNLRCDRYTRNECRNCTSKVARPYDLGEFGVHTHYGCAAGKTYRKGGCPDFKCGYSRADIEERFLEELRDPAVCGAKEPKIAALLWVLHDDTPAKEQAQSPAVDDTKTIDGIFGAIRRLFGQ